MPRDKKSKTAQPNQPKVDPMEEYIKRLKESLDENSLKLRNSVESYLQGNKDLGTPEEIKTIMNDIDMFLTSGKTVSNIAQNLGETLKDTKYDKERFKQFFDEYYRGFDYQTLFDEVGKTEPGLVQPSQEEINLSRETSIAAMHSVMDRFIAGKDEMTGDLATVTKRVKTSNITSRNFKAIMLTGSTDSIEQKRELISIFESGDTKKIKTEVEKAYKRHLSQEDKLNKNYSDKELAENWTELSTITLTSGMEYESFKKGLKDLGVEINPLLQKQMDDFSLKANAFNKMHASDIDYITSGLYGIGNKNVVKDSKTVAKLQQSKNPEIKKGGKALLANSLQAPEACGNYLKKTALGNTDAIETIYDKDGNTYKPDEASKYGKAFMEGKDLYCINKGEVKATKISKSDDGFVFDTKKETYKPATPEERDELFDMKMQALNKSDEPQAMKDIKENVIYNQYKLALICANPNSQNFAEDYKQTLCDLTAAVTIQQMAETTNPTPETLKNLSSSKALKDFSQGMKAAGIADAMVEKFKDNPSEAVEFSTKEMYGALLDAKNDISKKQDGPQAQQAEKQKSKNVAPVSIGK